MHINTTTSSEKYDKQLEERARQDLIESDLLINKEAYESFNILSEKKRLQRSKDNL